MMSLISRQKPNEKLFCSLKMNANSPIDSRMEFVNKLFEEDQKNQEKIQTSRKNRKILRNKILEDLKCYDDYKEVNLQSSIAILNKGKILRVLKSLEETKQKINTNEVREGRAKQQARFLYFLWKMIGEQTTTTRHLKQLIVLLNECDKEELQETLVSFYCDKLDCVHVLVGCWALLKLNRHHYESKSLRSQRNKENHDQPSSSKAKQCSDQCSNFHKQKGEFITNKERPLNKVKSQRVRTQSCQNRSKSNRKVLICKLAEYPHKNTQTRLYEEGKNILKERERIKMSSAKSKQKLELLQCTFKPKILNSLQKSKTSNFHCRSQSSISSAKKIDTLNTSASIKGFEKAVSRIKKGHSQSKEKEALRNYHSIGENYESLRQKPSNPPKFLERQRNPPVVLFVIEFQLGRHKVRVKIHPTDTEDSVAKKLSKIYGLKKDQEDEIRAIVSMELNTYYKKIVDAENQEHDLMGN